MKNQKGATFITAMLMLVIMTILGVSAVKVSSMDILVAGNDQRSMMLFQTAQTELNELSTPSNLLPPLLDNTKFKNDIYDVPSSNSNITKKIKSMKVKYMCQGIDRKAVSIGPSVPPCVMYEFKINTKQGSARESLRRGAGKEIPDDKKNSYL